MNTITAESELPKKLTDAFLNVFKELNPEDEKIQKREKLTVTESNKVLKYIISTDYETELSAIARDAFYEWHKHRVYDDLKAKKIIPSNVQTHTIVTALGHVCIIRKPMGRVLGRVMSKMGGFSGKDPDIYEAGNIVFQECAIYTEEPITNNPEELDSVKINCVKAVKLVEATIKKN